jgi:hypothetical protein
MHSFECRKYALQCLEIAETARPEHRERLLELAQKWLEVAAQIAELETGNRRNHGT